MDADHSSNCRLYIPGKDRVLFRRPEKSRLDMASEGYQASNENKHLRLINQVPDEIVSSLILSRLTMKEVARTRLVSHYWNRSWYHISYLNFEKPLAMEKIHKAYDSIKRTIDRQVLDQERRSFVNWVDNILENHVGSSVDQFVVTFDLDNRYQSHIDKWVVWALSRHVKILNLRFDPAPVERRLKSRHSRYVLHETLLEKYCTMKVEHVLTALCLTNVNVSTEFLKKILESCSSTLENLCIERSETLTSITTPLQSLKYLKVYECRYMETINISAPKLLSFKCETGSLFIYKDSGLGQIHIESASSLSHVSIEVCREDRLINAFGCLSSYFSRLEYLKLEWFYYPDINVGLGKNHPVLANLKHLELGIYGGDRPFGWIPLIVACPTLEKLTLQLRCWKQWSGAHIVKRDKQPLGSLKTLEIVEFVRCYTVVDIVEFVLENSVALREVIFCRRVNSQPKVPCGVSGLEIPWGVKVIFL